MRAGSTRDIWITAKDASLNEKDCGGIFISPNLVIPANSTKFAEDCSETKTGVRFAAETTVESQILCAVVPSGVTPSEAIKNGTGVVWGLTENLLDEMIDILQQIRDTHKNKPTSDE